MLDWQNVYRLVLEEVSTSRLLTTASQIHSRNARLSFSSLAESARWLAADLVQRGLEASDAFYPADGATKIGQRIMPLAWDVGDAELFLIEPDGSTNLLVCHDRRPYCVVMFSAATDGHVEAPLIYFQPRQPRPYLGWKDEDFEGIPIRGACVFFEVRPDAVLLEKLMQRGAAGFVLDGNGIRTAHYQRAPEAIRWVNDAFGEGMISKHRTTIPGFSISPGQGGELRERLQAGEKLRVKFRVESKTYDGEFHFVRGALPGKDRPTRRVFLLAHLFEPNISNNCSGVAVLAEALGTLRRLIDRGELPPAARTIELFCSWEMFGIAACATNNPEVRRDGVAGIGVDCLVRPDGPLGTESITFDAAPDSSPSFVNGLLREMLPHFARQSGVGWNEQFGFSGNDNMLSDPTLGPPTALLSGTHQFTDGTYHTDADTVEKLAPDRLAHIAALVATASYAIAAASADDAARFAEYAYARGRGRIGELADRVVDGSLDCPEQRVGLIAGIEQAAIASVTSLSDDPRLRERVSVLARLLGEFAELEQERIAAGAPSREAPSRDEALWREAASIIPSRNVPGPICLQDVSEELRREFEADVGSSITSVEWYGGTPDLFWVDGERDLAEICKSTRLRQPTPLHDDKALGALMKLYRFMERHGYITIRTRR